MAGSYNHCIGRDGKLLNSEELNASIENGGDVYEAIEELYGMLWLLADNYPVPADAVETARQNYRAGLVLSPGVDGTKK